MLRVAALSFRGDYDMRTWSIGTLAGCFVAAAFLAMPAYAQTDKQTENKTNSGRLQPPKPYGDRGSSTLGSQPIQYPTQPNTTRNPLDYWRGRIITGRQYYGNNIIIIGGAPCFVPYYYRYGLPG